MVAQPNSNSQEAENFFRTFYGENAPGYVPIWSGQDKRTRYIEASDPAEVARVATRSTDQDVYFGVGLQPHDLGPYRRGQGENVLGIPGVWADIDIQGPAHKDPDLPPTEQAALILLGEFPLPPTLVVHSGHGLQSWWLFQEPWIFRDEYERREARLLVRRFQETLRAKAESHGWRIDNTSDLARVMRLPGTFNHKLEPVPVRLMEVDQRAS